MSTLLAIGILGWLFGGEPTPAPVPAVSFASIDDPGVRSCIALTPCGSALTAAERLVCIQRCITPPTPAPPKVEPWMCATEIRDEKTGEVTKLPPPPPEIAKLCPTPTPGEP